MAANIDVTPGTGKTVKTTEVGGAQIQNVIVADSSGAEIDFTDPVAVFGTGTAGSPTSGTGTATTGVVTIQGVTSGTNVPVSQATASALNATVIGAGSAGTANAGVLTVQGIASMTPVQVSQATAASLNAQVVGNVAGGATDAGNPLKVGGVAKTSSLATVTDGQRVDWRMSTTGAGMVFLGSPASGSAYAFVSGASDGQAISGGSVVFTGSCSYVWNGASFDRVRAIANSFGSATGVMAVEQAGASKTNITTATTTQVKSGTGILHKVIVGTPVAAATISIYDATSGTTNPIGVITCAAVNAFEIEYNCDVTTGIRVITSGATDVTVVWR